MGGYEREVQGLKLSEIDVSVTYTRYINNHENATKDVLSNDKTLDDAVEAGLIPGDINKT